MSEILTVSVVEPTDGSLQLMTLLNESQRHHDTVIAKEERSGFLVRKSVLNWRTYDQTVGFSPAACGLLMSNEERLLL